MTGMAMHHPSGHQGATAYMGMWMLMMVPMMLPSLVPVLVWHLRSVRAAGKVEGFGLTGLVVMGYFAVWAAIGLATWAVGTGVAAAQAPGSRVGEWKPLVTGLVLLAACAVQVSSWKAKHLMCWRDLAASSSAVASPWGAWRHGTRLGRQCGLSCGNLMLLLPVLGMTSVAGMVMLTAVVTIERLAPASKAASPDLIPQPAAAAGSPAPAGLPGTRTLLPQG